MKLPGPKEKDLAPTPWLPDLIVPINLSPDYFVDFTFLVEYSLCFFLLRKTPQERGFHMQ